MLTGVFATDYSDALATLLFDLVGRRWASDLITALGLNGEIFPEVHPSTNIVDHVIPAAAVASGLMAGAPVVIGGGDGACATVGADFRTLLERARDGRSLPDDLTSGTFTITNLGMYDVDAFTHVINLPEAAILGVGRIASKVVAYHGEAAIRQMWILSLVFDHRLTNGAPAARFLQSIKQMVEEPYLLLTA